MMVKWIGLAKVSVLNESNILNGAKKAYVNVVGLSITKEKFRSEVHNKLQLMDLKLARLEEAEPLKDRLNKFKLSEDILSIVDKLFLETPIVFATFHCYPND